jgi:alpha-aminoadipate/glutamate carrier protein LysW
MSNCPECSAMVEVPQKARAGEVVICSGCQSQLEVINRNPLLLALAPEVEEDWGE